MALTKSQIFTLIGANLPDNTSGAITPAKLREVVTQIADAPIYAAAGVKEVEVLRAASTATQAPSAVDTALQVSFGVAQGSASDPVMLNAAGLVTFNTAGNYAIRIKLQNGRTGATGTSILLSRILLNGAQVGSAAAVKMQNITMKNFRAERFRKYGGRGQSKAFETHIFRRRVFLRFCGYLCRKRGAGKARREGYKPDKSAC